MWRVLEQDLLWIQWAREGLLDEVMLKVSL
jgi:hypothetical protein